MIEYNNDFPRGIDRGNGILPPKKLSSDCKTRKMTESERKKYGEWHEPFNEGKPIYYKYRNVEHLESKSGSLPLTPRQKQFNKSSFISNQRWYPSVRDKIYIENLIALRKCLGLTQAGFIREMGFSKSSYVDAERYRHKMNEEYAKQIDHKYHLPLRYLAEREIRCVFEMNGDTIKYEYKQ